MAGATKFVSKVLASALTVGGVVGVPLSVRAGSPAGLLWSSIALFAGILWLGKMAKD